MTAPAFSALVRREDAKKITAETVCADVLDAPLSVGDTIGQIVYSVDGVQLGTVAITAAEDIPRIGFLELFCRMLRSFSLGKAGASDND